MRRDDYDRFTQELSDRLEGDPRVLGLVALGSMSGTPPPPDEWSDHDFFVVTRPDEQERMRNDLSWLPRAREIVLAVRETAHGVKALYRDAHLIEFAVFDAGELHLARVNRYRILFDRADVERRMRTVREATDREIRPPDAGWLCGQILTGLLIGATRYRRGERLSGRARVQEAARHLVQLLSRHGSPDSLDPLRRFEQANPVAAAELDAALALPLPAAAIRILALARKAPEFPEQAAAAVERQLAAL